MTPNEVANFLKKYAKTINHVAAETKIHPITVQKYLDGGRCQPAYVQSILRYVQDLKSTLSYEIELAASTPLPRKRK